MPTIEQIASNPLATVLFIIIGVIAVAYLIARANANAVGIHANTESIREAGNVASQAARDKGATDSQNAMLTTLQTVQESNRVLQEANRQQGKDFVGSIATQTERFETRASEIMTELKLMADEALNKKDIKALVSICDRLEVMQTELKAALKAQEQAK